MARKLKLMKNIGTSALDDAKIARFHASTTGMGTGKPAKKQI